jgi:uncharacterized protein (TIGR03437 family)
VEFIRRDYGNVELLYNESLFPGSVNALGRAMITGDSDPVAALTEVAAAWSSIDGSAIRFATPVVTSEDQLASDGRSTVVLKDTPQNRSMVGTALAVTFSRVSVLSGEVVDSDIVLNPLTNELFGAPFATTGNANAIDFSAVVMHETGHLLGGNHSPLLGATMYYQGGTFDARKLSEDEKALARALASAAGTGAYGELSGTVLLPDGQTARGISVTATDRTSGVTLCALTDPTGKFLLQGVPVGNYVLFAEPLDGPTPLSALNLVAAGTDVNVEAMIVGGGDTPTVFPVAAGVSTVADFAMLASTAAVDIRFFARGRIGGSTDATSSGAAIQASRGETLDLIVGGPGVVNQLSNAKIELIGAGARVVPGSIRVDQARNTTQPTVRFTVEVTGAPTKSLVSVIYRTPTAMSTVPGALVAAPAGQSLTLNPNGIVNAASIRSGPVAPASWVSMYADNLASQFQVSGSSLATILDGTTVQVTDGAGQRNSALLQFVTNGQINFLMPSAAVAGTGRVTVTTSKGTGFADFAIENVAPGIFAANADGRGPAASTYLTVLPSGVAADFTFFANRTPRVNAPIDISGGDTYLIFYGTGLRLHASPVTASVGGVSVPVLAATAQGQFQGLDQINIGPLPKSLAGRGEVSVEFNVDGKATNPVTVNVK